MPAYDCGYEDCSECQRAFGPDRRRAIANYKAREAFMGLPYEERRAMMESKEAMAAFGAKYFKGLAP